ncbi:MAG TPA: hypothetical protein VI504_15785 [Candidatus Eisenbacteria bacterium]|jgi:hypothetical protein
MHKRMSRILAALSLLTVMPALALASPSRVQAMNVPGDFIKDYTGIYTYLSGVGSVGNLVYAEPAGSGSNSNNQAMGAVLGNLWEGHLGTWGVNLRRIAPTLGSPLFGDPVTTSAFFNDPNVTGEAFDVLWGHKMGNGSLGLRVNRSFISNEVTGGTAEGNGNGQRNIWGVGGGYGFSMNSNTDVELSGLFQNRSFKGSSFGTPDAAADDGGGTFQFAGRAFMKAGGNLVLIPVAKAYSFDLSSVDAAAVKTDAKLSGWQFGLSGDWSIGSDDLFILGAQFVGNKLENQVGAAAKSEARETYYPNVFMGLETHVNSWLALRFGAQNAMMYSLKTETGSPVVTVTQKLHQFTFNMGAGVKVGSLAFDATLTPQYWTNPVGATFNNGLGANPFPRVSATYSF